MISFCTDDGKYAIISKFKDISNNDCRARTRIYTEGKYQIMNPFLSTIYVYFLPNSVSLSGLPLFKCILLTEIFSIPKFPSLKSTEYIEKEVIIILTSIINHLEGTGMLLRKLCI